MTKSIAASLLVLALLCSPLRADDQPAPKKTIAFYLGYEGAQDKPFASVFVSTSKDPDAQIEKWCKDRHLSLQYSIRVAITPGEMEKIVASIKKPDANARPLFDTYRVYLLDAEGAGSSFQIPQVAVSPLLLAIAKCDIPKLTSEQLQGAANRFR